MEHLPPLSPRLQKIADLLRPCSCMADLGTDHGYLPVWLTAVGRCPSAIAADLNPAPLERAAETVAKYHQESAVSLRLGSGATPLQPGEANAIVLAGMGGLLIAQLLKESPHIFAAAEQILLQPMSSLPELREALDTMGYTICREVLVPEGKKLYHIMEVLPGREEPPLRKSDYILGRCLLRDRPPHFADYLAAQQKRLEQKREGLMRTRSEIPSEEWEETVGLLAILTQIKEEMESC